MFEGVKKFLAPTGEGFTVSEVESLLAATGSSMASARESFVSIAAGEEKAVDALTSKISTLQNSINSAQVEKQVRSLSLSNANALLEKLS